MALSYGAKKSLSEISKGQRELKCLLYEVCRGRELKIESQRKRPSARVAEREKKKSLFLHLMIFSINLTAPNSFPVLAAVVRWDTDSICDATLTEMSPSCEDVPKSKLNRAF